MNNIRSYLPTCDYRMYWRWSECNRISFANRLKLTLPFTIAPDAIFLGLPLSGKDNPNQIGFSTLSSLNILLTPLVILFLLKFHIYRTFNISAVKVKRYASKTRKNFFFIKCAIVWRSFSSENIWQICYIRLKTSWWNPPLHSSNTREHIFASSDIIGCPHV